MNDKIMDFERNRISNNTFELRIFLNMIKTLWQDLLKKIRKFLTIFQRFTKKGKFS
jgi:hypothetical protein